MFWYLLRVSLTREICESLADVRGVFNHSHLVQARSGSLPWFNPEKTVLHFM